MVHFVGVFFFSLVFESVLGYIFISKAQKHIRFFNLTLRFFLYINPPIIIKTINQEMLRRIGSGSSSTFARAKTHSQQLHQHRKMSMDGLNGDDSRATAGRLMCDTTDGAYRAMMATKQSTGSILGDSPAAIGTSLVGCFFFGATYVYYIGNAVLEAVSASNAGSNES